MPLRSVRRALFVTALTLFGSTSVAFGATDTSQLTVTATVESGCQLTGGTLDFGTYVSGQVSDLDVNGNINYSNCGPGVLTFELDAGLQSSGGNRFMASGDNLLRYEIFRNVARTAVWGQSGEAQDLQLLATQSGSLEVYGRVPANQAVPEGTYSDTVTITLTF